MTTTVDIGAGRVSVPQWRDKKRYLWLVGLVAPTALVVVVPAIWA
ncbi:MAG: alkane 1-monooxygenase, partial [Mycobacteriaceae bacterium]|nr:alkane 1-monooxygenase [Mycobacteriaceae bacterium]